MPLPVLYRSGQERIVSQRVRLVLPGNLDGCARISAAVGVLPEATISYRARALSPTSDACLQPNSPRRAGSTPL
ncbi:MAG: hypothetical protein Kow0010_10930 [Dehalococcoidia bacterium]